MTTVTIVELGSRGTTTTTRHRSSGWDAIRIAVKRRYGSAASFWRDQGLAVGYYGQIVVPTGQPGDHWRCVTGRVRIDVEEGR